MPDGSGHKNVEACRRKILTKITPLNLTDNNFSAQNSAKKNKSAQPEFEKSKESKPKRKYSDPLMQWPIRGMAFTNDIGAAIADIAPKAGMAMWVPALMYFGADIYDKYRNNKENYDPSTKRGLKQAIFQAFASVIFPIATVHIGQKTASLLARNSKEGLSLQSKEEVVRDHLNYMSQRKLKDYQGNIDEYKSKYNLALDNMIDETMRKHEHKNPFKLIVNLFFGHRHPEAMGKDRRQKLHDFIDNRIDNMFAMRKELLEGKKPEAMSEKMFKKFENLKETYKLDKKYSDDYLNHAAKDILKKFEENKIFKTKMAKTIGGFIALGLLIKPIDTFVENIIMHKYVGPGLDKIKSPDVSKYRDKFLHN